MSKINLISKDLLTSHLISLTQRLLDAIATGDWNTYASLCDEQDLTCIEPESGSAILKGQPFHRFFFDVATTSTPPSIPPVTTLGCPDVRILGTASDVAIVSYQRLVQVYDSTSKTFVIRNAMETRVWHKRGNEWKLAHFHRSKL